MQLSTKFLGVITPERSRRAVSVRKRDARPEVGERH